MTASKWCAWMRPVIVFLSTFLPFSSLHECDEHFKLIYETYPQNKLHIGPAALRSQWCARVQCLLHTCAPLWPQWCARVQCLLVLWEGMGALCRQFNRCCALSCVFTMFKKIEKPILCEMRSVIRFLDARNVKPADIHCQLCEVYGEHAMSDSMAQKWVRHFNEGWENVHDDPWSGRPSGVVYRHPLSSQIFQLFL
jgi:hypothetical protein